MPRPLRLMCLAALVWSAAHAADSPPTLEGPNVLPKEYLVIAGTNCGEQAPQGQPPAEFVEAWCTIRAILPGSTSKAGPVTACICRYHKTDLYPGLATGRWDTASATCPPGYRAVVTRWYFGWSHGGGDSGCDDPGPACTPGVPCALLPLPAALVKKPMPKAVKRLGRCLVDKRHQMTCALK